MENLIFQAVAVALFAAFVILLMNKTGIRDRVVTHGSTLISKLFGCDFCLSFWVAVILSICSAIITNKIELLFIPFLSTPLTRILI